MGFRQTDATLSDAQQAMAAKQLANGSGKGMLSSVLRLSLILGVCLHVIGFLFFRIDSDPLPERSEGNAFVQFVSSNRLGSSEALEEQAELLDTAPLFLPGQWNAAHNLRAPARDLALQRFPFYEPQIDVRAELQPERTPIGERFDATEPSELLALRYWDLFQGFGERSQPVPELRATGSFAEIRRVGEYSVVTRPVELEWTASELANPVTFTLRMEAAGRAAGPPVLHASSGNGDFDAEAERWLNRTGNTADWSAGLYRIRFYP